MKIAHKTIFLKTKQCFDFINLTEEIKSFIKESDIKNGLINIQSMHTTGAIIVNEDEPLLIEDMKHHLERLVSQDFKYRHDDFTVRTVNLCDDECANGHAHCKAILLQANVTLNLIDKKLQLGQWQQIFFLELDRARERKVQIQIIGE
jgi:secondary thiamine-phosphate synthase enzyme